jgi:4-oxalomesaconate tautomerase
MKPGKADAVSGVRCMLMRGGTSKGSFFLADDLPSDPEERDELVLRIMGSPDPRQIDGVGGAHPLTTKVAVVGPSADPRAEIDYLFLQPLVDRALVSDAQNCGNMLAAVGPFALERGLAHCSPAGDDGRVSIRIRMVNTDSIAVASFPVDETGFPHYRGDTAISGVPGTAAAVRINFENVAGGSCGSLLPTGSLVDELDGVPCTLIDCGMPVVVMRAESLGLAGTENCAQLETNPELGQRLERIRLQAGPLMNLGHVADTTVPKLTLVAAPTSGGTVSTRTFIPHRCHDAIGVLGALSVAVAVLTDGSAVSAVRGPAELDDDGAVRCGLEHPTGVFATTLELRGAGVDVDVVRAGIIRTARKLMDGFVFPREYP